MCWTEIIKSLITVGGAVLAAYLAYHYAIKKLREESIENIERKKYEAILKAHQSIYRLLAYTTDTENPKSILEWRRTGNGADAVTLYFYRKENIEKFLEELPALYYGEGNGLFFSKEVNALLFEYRSIVYGFTLVAKNKEATKIEITNPKAIERMKAIHQELAVTIRNNIHLQQRDLKNI